MAVQKRKKSKSMRNMRRSHNALKEPTLSIEPETGELHRRHHVSDSGYYRGERVLPEVQIPEEDDQ